MVDTYSPNLALTLQETGTNSGTWGTITNTNLGTLIEQAISGYVTQAITDGAATVITIPNGATGVARNMTLELTGALTAARVLEVPTNKKLYFIYNNTTGGYAVTVKVSGQTGVSVPNGKKMILVSNGTDIVEAVNYAGTISGGSLTLTGNLSVGGTSGFTGVATFTAQPIMSSLTASQAVFTDGSKGLVSNAITGTGNVVMSNSPTLVTPALGTPSSGVVTNLTGTASININGTVGATTPTTGAFTTLSASSSVTFSGGTANGVLYLNGSKVATSGSALTFDGTTFATTAIGSFTGGVGIAGAGNPSSGASVEITYGAAGFTGVGRIMSYDRTGAARTPLALDGSYQQWLINNAEQMRLTSTGLGIGTSSVSSKLDVVGVNKTNGNEYGTITAWSSDSYAADKGGSIAFWGKYNSSSGNACFGRIYGAKENGTDGSFLGYLGFSTSPGGTPVERLRLDSSGNLGLGVTPSAWGSNWRANQVGLFGNYSYGAGGVWLTANAYNDNTNWRYANSNWVSAYQQQGGTHAWYTAPSGTANDPITFTQAMTLDASGNLGIGTTSPVNNSGYAGLTMNGSSGAILSMLQGGTETFRITNATGYSFVNTTGATPLLFGTSATERMRLDSSGNLTLGSTTSLGKLGVWSAANGDILAGFRCAGTGTQRGLYISGDNSTGVVKLDVTGAAGGTLAFATGSTETARIDASGNLGLGVTPSSWATSGSAYKVFQYGVSGFLAGRTGNEVLYLGSNAYQNGTNWIYAISGNYASLYQQAAGVHSWYTAPSGTANTTTVTSGKSYTIITAGGTNYTSFGAANNNVGTSFTATSSGTGNGGAVSENIVFTQAMTLDASGNLMVGTTTPIPTANGISILPSSAVAIGHATGTASGNYYVGFYYNGTAIGSITQNGTTGVLYNITSDQRLKTNIVNAPDASLIIDSIKVRSFDWLIDGSHQRYGMVAQELLEVAPEAVSVPTEDDEMMGVDYSKLVPMLVKEIQSLRARVANLEKL